MRPAHSNHLQSLCKISFALGIIGAGLLAVPVLAASTGYVVAELFGWRDSLSDSPHKARGFYMILTISFLIGIGIVFSGIRPVHALLYSQVLGGIGADSDITHYISL